jgi:hypothetical protein
MITSKQQRIAWACQLTALIARRVALGVDALEAAAKDAAGLGYRAELLRDEHRVLAGAAAADADVCGVGAHFLSSFLLFFGSRELPRWALLVGLVLVCGFHDDEGRIYPLAQGETMKLEAACSRGLGCGDWMFAFQQRNAIAGY